MDGDDQCGEGGGVTSDTLPGAAPKDPRQTAYEADRAAWRLVTQADEAERVRRAPGAVRQDDAAQSAQQERGQV